MTKSKPNYDTRTKPKSLKVCFWTNLAEAYERCVCRIYDDYVPNMWHRHFLDKSLKKSNFYFGEI